MGIFVNAIEKSKAIEKRKAKNPYDDFWYDFLPKYRTQTGLDINEKTALTVSTVFACINVISQDIGKLPLIFYRRKSDDWRERAVNHSLYNLLHYQANSEMTSMTWRQTMQSHILGWGNGYSFIEKSRDMKVKALWPLRPDKMRVYRDKDTSNVVYEYKMPGTGKPEYFNKNEIFHVYGMGFDGLVGYSPISMAREAIGLARGAEIHGASYFGNTALPLFYMVHPGQMGDEGIANFTESWKEEHKGLGKHFGFDVLEEGMEIKTIGIPNQDMQFLETRDFQTNEIARFYRMKMHKIENLTKSSFNNISEQNIEYVTDTLQPWCVLWEQIIHMSLLNDTEKTQYFAEFLIDGLLRGDVEARGKFYKDLFYVGAISPNEISRRENLPPVEGGDDRFVPVNVIKLSKAGNITKISDKNLKLEEKKAENSEKQKESISEQYSMLFEDAYRHCLSKEANTMKRHATKVTNKNEKGKFLDWMKEFYEKDMLEFYIARFSPLIQSCFSMANLKNKECELYIEEFCERNVRDSINNIEEMVKIAEGNEIANKIDEYRNSCIENRIKREIDLLTERIIQIRKS